MNFNFTSQEVKLLAKITGKTDNQIWLGEFELNKKQDKTWQKLRQKLQKGVPLDYLIGQIKLQNGLKLEINQNVLIPRPETEFWLQIMIKNMQKSEIEKDLEKQKFELGKNLELINSKNNSEISESQNKSTNWKTLEQNLTQNVGPQNLYSQVKIQENNWSNKLENNQEIKIKNSREKSFQKEILVEIGCGSGLICASLSPYFKKIIAIDKSAKALKIARKNIVLNKIKNVEFQKADLLDFDLSFLCDKNWILVANLPYLPIEDLQTCVEKKINFEPKMALFSGKDGLNCFKKLVRILIKIQNQRLPKKQGNEIKFESKIGNKIEKIKLKKIQNNLSNSTLNPVQNSIQNETLGKSMTNNCAENYPENEIENNLFKFENATKFWQNLKLPSEIWLELDPRNIKLAQNIINSKFKNCYQTQILQDYNDLERVLICKKAKS